MYPHCAQNTAPYQAEHHHRKIVPLRTKRSIIIARLHHFVPSGASSSQDCTTSYQAEHHHRKIAPLRTKQSIVIARLHHFVPSRASSSQDCTTLYQAEQSCSEPRCPVCCSRCHVWLQHRSVPSRTTIIAIYNIYHQRVRTKRCGPFSITKSNQSQIFALFLL